MVFCIFIFNIMSMCGSVSIFQRHKSSMDIHKSLEKQCIRYGTKPEKTWEWGQCDLLVYDCGQEHLWRDLGSAELQEVQVCIYHGVAEITLDVCHGLSLDLQAITHPHVPQDFIKCDLHTQTLHVYRIDQRIHTDPSFKIVLWSLIWWYTLGHQS